MAPNSPLKPPLGYHEKDNWRGRTIGAWGDRGPEKSLNQLHRALLPEGQPLPKGKGKTTKYVTMGYIAELIDKYYPTLTDDEVDRAVQKGELPPKDSPATTAAGPSATTTGRPSRNQRKSDNSKGAPIYISDSDGQKPTPNKRTRPILIPEKPQPGPHHADASEDGNKSLFVRFYTYVPPIIYEDDENMDENGEEKDGDKNKIEDKEGKQNENQEKEAKQQKDDEKGKQVAKDTEGGKHGMKNEGVECAQEMKSSDKAKAGQNQSKKERKRKKMNQLFLRNDNGKTMGLGNTHDFFITRSWKRYPDRGRGPIWLDNSCASDCCIVAALLLGMGKKGTSSQGETDEWYQNLKGLDLVIIDTIREDWDNLDPKTNGRARDMMIEAYIKWYNTEHPKSQKQTRGSLQSAVHMWSHYNNLSDRFALVRRIWRNCTVCGDLGTQLHHIRSIEPQGSKTPPSIKEVLQQSLCASRPVEHRTGCLGPNGVLDRRYEVVGTLPVWLQVNPSQTVPCNLSNATSNHIELDILHDGMQKKVVYRWLGRIYLSRAKNHYRVYWTDGDYNNRTGNVRIYDGMVNGHIVGGVPPDHPDDRVPDYWARGAHVLFYEKVDLATKMTAPQFPARTSKIVINSPVTNINILTSVTATGSVPIKESHIAQQGPGNESNQQGSTAGSNRGVKRPGDDTLPDEKPPSKKQKSIEEGVSDQRAKAT